MEQPPGGSAPGAALNGARVLITRSPERAAPVAAALAAAGATPLLLPLIDFERAADQHALDVACDALSAGAYGWLVISSATTVHALAGKARERGLALRQLVPAGTRIAAVGPATRRELEAEGLQAHLVPAGGQSAAGLLEVWPGGGTVLLPQADIAAPLLAEGLSAAGSSVTAVTAYHTVEYPAAAERRLAVGPEARAGGEGPPSYVLLTPEGARTELAAGRVDAALAASPSAVRRLAELLPDGACRLVVIGRSTAEQAAALDLRVAEVAAEPTPAGLVAAVTRALNPP
ncbi:uroporphyrinogen-III synthase [Pseudarthrobacter sp. NPDC058362]|uniref:uroporphyrinogen-III synthase n=1 Tax=unclassified Pseudarthrobacter TaxID=2647000 RepID=UPI003650859E